MCVPILSTVRAIACQTSQKLDSAIVSQCYGDLVPESDGTAYVHDCTNKVGVLDLLGCAFSVLARVKHRFGAMKVLDNGLRFPLRPSMQARYAST